MKRSPLTRKTPLAHGSELKRSSPPKRSRTRVNPVNRERKAKGYARNFGDEADAIRHMTCLICRGFAEPAHVIARGMGGAKGGRFDLAPLCREHHVEAGEAETSQRAAFETKYSVDLRAVADRIAAEHDLPMGIRGVAVRWVAPPRRQDEQCCTACAGRGHPAGSYGSGSSCGACDGRGHVYMPLDDYERSALRGWLRRSALHHLGPTPRHLATWLGAPEDEAVELLAWAEVTLPGAGA